MKNKLKAAGLKRKLGGAENIEIQELLFTYFPEQIDWQGVDQTGDSGEVVEQTTRSFGEPSKIIGENSILQKETLNNTMLVERWRCRKTGKTWQVSKTYFPADNAAIGFSSTCIQSYNDYVIDSDNERYKFLAYGKNYLAVSTTRATR